MGLNDNNEENPGKGGDSGNNDELVELIEGKDNNQIGEKGPVEGETGSEVPVAKKYQVFGARATAIMNGIDSIQNTYNKKGDYFRGVLKKVEEFAVTTISIAKEMAGNYSALKDIADEQLNKMYQYERNEETIEGRIAELDSTLKQDLVGIKEEGKEIVNNLKSTVKEVEGFKEKTIQNLSKYETKPL